MLEIDSAGQVGSKSRVAVHDRVLYGDTHPGSTSASVRSTLLKPQSVDLLVVGLEFFTLDRPPPSSMLRVPVNGRAQAFFKRSGRRPAQCFQTCAINRIPSIVGWPILDIADERQGLLEVRENGFGDRKILALVAAADVIDRARFSMEQGEFDPATVIEDRASRGGIAHPPYNGRGCSSSAFVINSGMNFSGYWLGPWVLLPRVMSTGNR